ncbi:hypothetical protein QTP70_024145 [Hemibagrus guttatus]|uniref:Reverse transcriptase domain-containing protein n=1 Tax=Hemibagrus guttatus TaxID=175788 RepID=A0AAE0QG83_9TELE|nr:hypothetical protein QTP70_024145 [Hemibagrus guttatus]
MNNQAEQLLKEKVNMADHILSVARDAVLKESGALPEDMPQIRGYDFNQGVDHRALLHSYLTTGFQASSFAMAVQEINKMIDRRLEPVEEQEHTCDSQQSQSGCTIFLGYTSNLISSGVRESIRYLAQHKMVDVMVTTAGGIEEDLIKCLAPTYLGEFSLPGKELRQRGINRIGNLLVPNDNYCKFEDWLMPILNQMVLEQKTEGTCWTPSKMIHRLGKEINNPDSVYYWAYKNDIPVFSPAITDGSLGDMIYFHSYKNPGLVLDIVEDIRRLNCKAVFAKSTGMIILGGGLVKHHIANANLMRNGADFAVYVNTGQEFDGSDSGARPDEAVSWGKIRMDAKPVKKREEHRVTYKSGGRRTQVDYILCRRGNLKEISDCKVVVGESVARQHRMVVCRMTLMVCKKKRSEIEKKTKWWKLKKEECCEEFRQKLRQALGGQVVLPDDWETTAEVIRETGRKVLGVSSGRRKEDKETWWWNEEVQDSIQRKRLAKKKWDMDRTEENRQEYKELQRRVKREVSKAKQKAYDELYTRLDTREGEKDLYRLARQRDRDGKDVQQVRVIKDRDGRVLTSEESVQRRWKEYFEELMNEENEREKRVEGVNSVEQKVDKIRKDEVRKALKRMKSGKAVGPDDIPVEVWKCLGEAAVEFLASLFNRVLESERMPEEWRRSVLVPIFKNKGDVQSCSNYRGIKLMSHTMKVWERVVEARLRKVVEICEQQYGFMPRKSTTDAIFALRILMEKYRDGQRELHCVFVDLEKAYDRVPREELWYCMRKSGVAEKYVRVVQDMYERSRTVVRCAVGQTEEFNVEVGLHQGSALSPFLFAIVMDQLSEEVRQESPWTMMFADDIVICSESREQVEENLERWRFALERRGMKVSRSKTEYMCVNEREGSGTVRLQGEEVKKVQEFKYLGSTVQSNGECGKEVYADASIVFPLLVAETFAHQASKLTSHKKSD